MLAEWRFEYKGFGDQFPCTISSRFTDLARLEHCWLYVGSLVLTTVFFGQDCRVMDWILFLSGFLLMTFFAWVMKEM